MPLAQGPFADAVAADQAGARHVALEILQLRLEALQEREGVGGGAREAGQHAAAVQAANLVSVALHHDVAERHLAVAAHGDALAAANGEDGGAVEVRVLGVHGLPRRAGQCCSKIWAFRP